MTYPVVIERTKEGTYCAYSPDVPGCVATGKSVEELRPVFEQLLRDFLRRTRDLGGQVPEPGSVVFNVEIEDEVA
jgi:predicted RNase H-like HicB family nuclease